MKRHRGIAALVAIIALVGLAIASASLASASGTRHAQSAACPIQSSKTVGTTHGPSGETATPTSALKLNASEIGKLRAGHYTAALVWHQSSDFVTAVTAGARSELKQLGIKVIAQTQANFNAATQKSQIETVEAKHPSAMLTLPVDPVVTASAYKTAAKQGTKIVLLSNVPQGFKYGRDYVDVVTDDLFQMGKHAADALAASMCDKGTVAYFFHNANYYVTNQRDQAFLKTIETNYPQINVVAKVGIADPTKAQDQANATLLQNPTLSGIYVTFSQPPAEGVLAALRANSNTSTRLVSLDLDEPLALDLAKGGNTFALVADKAYELGHAMAMSAAYGLLGKKAPRFVVAPALTITKSNLIQGYHESLHQAPPAAVLKALGK
jgi:ribose transport system substrate-binding protein